MTRAEHEARRAILTRLLQSGIRSPDVQAETVRIHLHRNTVRLAARLGVLLGALFLATAVLALIVAMNNPWHAVVFLLGLVWAAWGKHYLSTRH